MRYAWKSMLLCACLLLGASVAYGQRDGVANFSATDAHDLDVINLSTLVPSLNIPLVGKGAGVLPGSIAVESPQSCRPYFNGSDTGTDCGYFPNGNTGTLAGFYFIPQEMMNLQVNYTWVNSNGCTTYTIAGTGGLQGLDQLSSYDITGGFLYYPSNCGTNSMTQTTIDGTGLTVTISSVNGAPTVTAAYNNSGWSATYPSAGPTITDPFGNTIVLGSATFTDSLGAATTLAATQAGSPTSFKYNDTTGTQQTISFVNGTAKTFYPFNNTCGIANANSSVTPVSSISYPDGTSVSFTWDTTPISGHSGTLDGLIKSYTMRAGGTVTFTYGSLQNNCGPGFYGWAYGTLTRTTADGSTTYTNSTVNGNTTTTVLDPGKNKTVYTFNSNSNAGGYGGTFIQTIYRYQNTGTVASPVYTLISNTKYCYNTDTHCDGTVLANYPITQRDTYEYVGASSTQMSHRKQTYDGTYGLLLTDSNTDSVTGQVIIKYIRYGTASGGTCVTLGNANVRDHVCDVQTWLTAIGAGGTQLAEKQYTYNTNGAVTSESEWNGSSWLTTNYTANTNGTTATVTAPNGQVTTNTYGNCNSLLLTDSTTTVNSVAIDNKTTWDCNGAVPLDTTDPNGNEADTTYDVMFRPASQTDRMENTTTFSYGGTTNNYFTSTDPLGIVRYRWTDGLGRTTLNQVRQSPSSSNYDTVSTVYQWNGTNFQTQTTVACVQTYGNGCPATYSRTELSNPVAGPISLTNANNGTTTYGLGFSSSGQDSSVTAGPAPSGEHTKVVQTEKDGFGRTKSICSLETSGGTSCGQALGNSGILTSSSYSFATGSTTATTTRGSQTHTTISDALGRTTSITTPEAGTVTSYYDTIPNPQCYQSGINESGFLTATKDNAGNYICPETDGIGRVYAVGSGSYCKRFVYDISTGSYPKSAPSGYPSSGANIIGRLVEAETDNCGAPLTTYTDEWFAYDKDGRMTDMWQSTPNSGGYLHETAGYDADGEMTSLSSTSGFPAFTFGMDGEDRPFNSQQGSTWIVGSSSTTGVTYDAASRPLTVPLGSSGDKDVLTYDNVGNMTEFTFTVNGTSFDGKLTWNPIGSLQKLAITDGFYTGGSQTCTYLYDDVARLGVPPNSPTPPAATPKSVDCGTVFNQEFGYDQYDNLTQAGTLSWAPGYSSTNNEMTGSTYDSDGNVKYDGVNTYTWDVYGKMATFNNGSTAANCGTSGVCMTYDAFGQNVEENQGGSIFGTFYPFGVMATWFGTTKGMTVLQPGGGRLYVNSTGTINYEHSDWLGSSRLTTTISGRTSTDDLAWAPFGQKYNIQQSNGYVNFTGLVGRIDGTLKDTPNRELMTNAGRWPSPDPAHASWNAYSYVTNPNSQTDRTGLCDEQDTSDCEAYYGPGSQPNTPASESPNTNNCGGPLCDAPDMPMTLAGAADELLRPFTVQPSLNPLNLTGEIYTGATALGATLLAGHLFNSWVITDDHGITAMTLENSSRAQGALTTLVTGQDELAAARAARGARIDMEAGNDMADAAQRMVMRRELRAAGDTATLDEALAEGGNIITAKTLVAAGSVIQMVLTTPMMTGIADHRLQPTQTVDQMMTQSDVQRSPSLVHMGPCQLNIGPC